jgi:hypothetical protein
MASPDLLDDLVAAPLHAARDHAAVPVEGRIALLLGALAEVVVIFVGVDTEHVDDSDRRWRRSRRG